MIGLGGATGESPVLLLAALGALVVLARLAGSGVTRLGVPAFVGELAAGFILGPSVAGLVRWPTEAVFSTSGSSPLGVASGLLWLSALVLVVFHFLDGFGRLPRPLLWTVLFSSVGIAAVGTSLGLLLLLLLRSEVAAAGGAAVGVTVVAGALLVCEVPNTIRLLREQRLSGTDVALVSVAQASFASLLGWFLLALGASAARIPYSPWRVALSVSAGAVLLVLAGTFGRSLAGRFLANLEEGQPAAFLPLTIALGGGCLLGALTHEVVGHALAGAAVAGWVVGSVGRFSEREGVVLEGLARGFASPLFFAYLGSRLDLWSWVSAPKLAVLLGLLVVGGTIARVGGTAVGAWLGRMAWADALAVGLVANSRGAAGALAAFAAHEAGSIGEGLFVGLILLSATGSALASPSLRWSLRRRRRIDFSFFHRVVIVGELQGRTRREVIRELVLELGKGPDLGDREIIIDALLEREESMPTGLPNGLAIPHARLGEIERPFLAIGRSPVGVDFGSPDGLPARLIFLLLSPERDEGTQLQVLATIAGAMNDPERRSLLLNSKDTNELLMHFEEVFRG